MDLHLSTRQVGDRAVVSVGGEVDLETASQLGDHASRRCATSPRTWCSTSPGDVHGLHRAQGPADDPAPRRPRRRLVRHRRRRPAVRRILTHRARPDLHRSTTRWTTSRRCLPSVVAVPDDLSRSIRACSCSAVACAAGGPPQVCRSSACTTPCGWPVRWSQAPTRPFSSLRSAGHLPVRRPRRRAGAPRRRCAPRGLLGALPAAAAAWSPGPAPAGRGGRGSPPPPRVPTAAWVPNSPPSNSTRSNVACASSASNGSSSAPGVGLRPVGLRRAARPPAAKRPLVVADRPVERVVALDLHLGRELQQRRHGRQEDRRRLAAPAGPHEPADGLREEQRRRAPRWRRRRPPAAARRRPRTPSGPRPSSGRRRPANSSIRALAPASSESTTTGASPVILAQQRGVGAGGLVVGGDHQAAGVRDAAAHLGQPLVGGREHRRDPLALRVERGPPGLRPSGPWSAARRAWREISSPALVRQRISPE